MAFWYDIESIKPYVDRAIALAVMVMPELSKDPNDWYITAGDWEGMYFELDEDEEEKSDAGRKAQMAIQQQMHLANPEVKAAMGYKPTYVKKGPDLATRQKAMASESIDRVFERASDEMEEENFVYFAASKKRRLPPTYDEAVALQWGAEQCPEGATVDPDWIPNAPGLSEKRFKVKGKPVVWILRRDMSVTMQPMDGNTAGYTPADSAARKREYQEKYGKTEYKKGYAVKLAFKDPQGKQVEHMWVKVTGKKPDGTYTGKLDNDPAYLTHVKKGYAVTFKPEDVEAMLD